MSGAVQPLLGYGAKRVDAVFSFVHGSAGYVGGGIFGATSGPIKTATRQSNSFSALATAPDNVISGFDSNGVDGVYFAGGLYIIGDSSGNIASSTDGVSWTLGLLNSGGDPLATEYGLVYDDVHNKLIALVGNSGTRIATAAATQPLNFTVNTLPAGVTLSAIGYRAGSGVTLGTVTGTANAGNIYRSTDGGSTWTQTATNLFSGNNSFFVGFGSSQWLALGGDASTLTSVSTDNGSTWSAPVSVLPLPTFPNIATDGAGNWVLVSDNLPPDNYAVSSSDGSTWSSPNLFATQGGWGDIGMYWDGSHWNSNFYDATQSYVFLATSSNGQTWTVGPTITD